MNNQEIYLADAISVIEEVLANGGEFRLYPKGMSMRPLIVQGRDSVVLKRNFDVPAKKHDIAFYRREDGSFVLHRVMKVSKDGKYTMCGDNQFLFEKDIDASNVIAYVSDVYRGERRISVKALKYKIYVFLWTKMPVRKIAVWLNSHSKKQRSA